jgi:hypothetical protein
MLEMDSWEDDAAVEKWDKEPVLMKMWHCLVVAKETLKGCIPVNQAVYPATSTLLDTAGPMTLTRRNSGHEERATTDSDVNNLGNGR